MQEQKKTSHTGNCLVTPQPRCTLAPRRLSCISNKRGVGHSETQRRGLGACHGACALLGRERTFAARGGQSSIRAGKAREAREPLRFHTGAATGVLRPVKALSKASPQVARRGRAETPVPLPPNKFSHSCFSVGAAGGRTGGRTTRFRAFLPMTWRSATRFAAATCNRRMVKKQLFQQDLASLKKLRVWPLF